MGRGGEYAATTVVTEHVVQRGPQPVDVTGWHQHRAGVVEDVGDTADGARDHAEAGGHRLEHRHG